MAAVRGVPPAEASGQDMMHDRTNDELYYLLLHVYPADGVFSKAVAETPYAHKAVTSIIYLLHKLGMR